jgi:hypothetical protein
MEPSKRTESESEVTARFPPKGDLGDEVEPMQSLLTSEWWVIAMTRIKIPPREDPGNTPRRRGGAQSERAGMTRCAGRR